MRGEEARSARAAFPRGPWERGKETQSLIPLDIIEELDHIHTTLDHAVLDAYGWPHTLTDDQILEHLLALNLERAHQAECEG